MSDQLSLFASLTPETEHAKPLETINALIERGAVFYCSHSGGKDSQAMYAQLQSLVPASLLAVIHADLGVIEWDGVIEHIRATIDSPLSIVRAVDRNGHPIELLERIEQRAAQRPDAPAWPSAKIRYCTSDLKRAPIEKEIRADLQRRGARLAVNCIGLRAEESPSRAKRSPLVLNTRLSKAGREIYDWLPIHHWLSAEVFQRIAAAGQQPHPAYRAGNERLSCVFCIFGSNNDLQNGARARPELAARYIELERKIGRTMFATGSLAERLGMTTTTE